MDQIVLQRPGEFLLRQTEPPIRRDQEALVRVRHIGVCGTDLNAFEGRQAFFDYPRVIGHELSVEVIEAPADDSTQLHPGDRCAVEPYLACGNCKMCRSGRRNCCPHAQCLGVHRDGGMQQFLSVDASLLHRSQRLTPEKLALVETLGIGAHAVERGDPQPGQSVLIIGLGPIGLAVLEFARLIDCRITVMDRMPERREFVGRYEVAVADSPRSAEYDVVFDATGNRESMEAAVDQVAFGGTLVLVGIVNEDLRIHDPTVHRRELTIKGTRNSVNSFPAIIETLETGRIDVEPWITRTMSFHDVPAKFVEIRQDPRMIKTVIDVKG